MHQHPKIIAIHLESFADFRFVHFLQEYCPQNLLILFGKFR